jgi:hypothetical protein
VRLRKKRIGVNYGTVISPCILAVVS